MEFIKLSVDGEVEKLSYVDKSNDEEEYYHAFNAFIHEAIDCDCYEMAPAYNLMCDDIAMLVDEEGKLIGKRINHVAWILCNGANIFDEIVGDVLFCGLCRTGEYDELDFCGLSEEQAESLIDMIKDVKRRSEA